ncbi:hypothetical protein HYT01_02400 [Candidatus Giovannonibacteria bacterium]|nr:hypothetical protein [Candidatus Giovannonibacteria bacterium]
MNIKYISLIAIYYLLTIKSASAVQIYDPLPSGTTFETVVRSVGNMLKALGIPLAVIFFIWAGFLFVTAQGNEQQIEKAKKAFWWTVVGTALLVGAIVLSEAIVDFAKGL